MSKQKSLFFYGKKYLFKLYRKYKLYVFVIWDNQIGDEGCIALSTSIPHLTNLTQLLLNGNSKLFESTIKLVYILNFKITVLDGFVVFSFWMSKQKSLFLLEKNLFKLYRKYKFDVFVMRQSNWG